MGQEAKMLQVILVVLGGVDNKDNMHKFMGFMKSTLKYLKLFKIHLLFMLLIVSCGEGCIEADDFGIPRVKVQAKGYTKDGNFYEDSKGSQVSLWHDSGLKLNGKFLYMESQGAWTAWFGDNGDVVNDKELVNCHFPQGVCIPEDYDDPKKFISNAPCRFINGIGLYSLLIKKDKDPNQDLRTIQSPGILGAITQNFAPDYGKVGVEPQHNDKLYFKIIDKFYKDNEGSYTVLVKSGAVDPGGLKPIQGIITSTQEVLGKVYQAAFEGLIQDSEFIYMVRLTLTIYIIFTAICILFGIVQVSQGELLIRILKIAIIIQLITSESSWNFFNNYLFKLFTDGMLEVINIAMSNITGGAGGGFAFFDDLLQTFFAPVLHFKLFSLIFSTGEGIIFYIAVWVAIILICLSVLNAVFIYIMSFMVISLLIMIAPIFISYMLFSATKQLFDSWLKQFIIYVFQPFMIILLIGILSQVVYNQFYSILGYKFCYSKWFDIPSSDISIGIWKAENIDKNEQAETIRVPHFYEDPDRPGYLCQPYECFAKRYKSMPYLDIEKDKDKIKRIQEKGDFVGWGDIITLLLLVGLVYVMSPLCMAIAKILATGSPFTRASLSDVFGGRFSFFDLAKVPLSQLGSKLSQGMSYLGNKVSQTKVGRGVSHLKNNTKVGRGVTKAVKLVGKAPGAIQDQVERAKYLGLKNYVDEGERIRRRGAFSIGEKYDAVSNIAGMVKDSALHNLSFGILGEDPSKKYDPNINRNLIDRRMDELADAFNMKPVKAKALKNAMHRTDNDIKKFANKELGVITGLSMINPIVAPVFAASKVHNFYKTYKEELTKLENKRQPHNPAPGNPAPGNPRGPNDAPNAQPPVQVVNRGGVANPNDRDG